MDTAPKPLAIGGKSAAWLRQVGIRTWDDVHAVGALEAFMRVKRAGFRPSLNLLYALEGVLVGCHWQQVAIDRRTELAAQAQAATALLPSSRRTPPPSAVTTVMGEAHEAVAADDVPDALSF